jgi:hypothetical protein
MSKKEKLSKIGRSDKAARHIRLYHWVMDTPAWQSLEVVDPALYIELLKRYGGPGSNNGNIPYSVREAAERLHIGKSTASQAFRRLEERGFIATAQKGGFNCKIRRSTEWRLTEFACDVDIPEQGIKAGTLATRDFVRWQPKKQNTVPIENRKVSGDGQDGALARTVPLKKVAYSI